MASRFSKIQTSLWDSQKFNKLSEFHKLVYIYLLSCPHGNSAGFFRLKEAYAIADLGCTDKRYREALMALNDAELISYNGDVVLVHQFLKFNAYCNEKHAKGSKREIEDFESDNLYSLFYTEVSIHCPDYINVFDEPLNTVSIPYQNSISTNTDTDTDTDTITNDAPAAQGASPAPVKVDIYDGRSFSPAMKDKLDEWLKYKAEKRDGYKPTGLVAFLSQVENNLKKYPEADVISLIDVCMAANWKGIIWDKLGKTSPDKPKRESFERPVENYDHLCYDPFAVSRDKLIQLRKGQGFSVEDMAAACSTTTMEYQGVEGGQYMRETLRKQICKILGVSENEIF